MAKKDVFEDKALALVVSTDPGFFEKIKSVTFKFTQSGGQTTLPDTPAEASGGKKYTAQLTLPKVKDDEDKYSLSYKFDALHRPWIGSDKHVVSDGPDRYTVWPEKISIKGTKDPNCKVDFENVPYTIVYPGRGDASEYTSDDKFAVAEATLKYTGDYQISTNSPYYIKDWKHKTGRAQEATVGMMPWRAKIIAPADGKTADAPHKQYVNLPGEGNGSLLKIEVGPTDLNLGVKDEEIKVRVSFPKENSKRNDPLPALWLGPDSGTAQSAKKTGAKPGIDELVYETVLKLPADKGKVVFYVQLGVAGDDKCKVEVGTTDKYDDDVMHIVTCRKIYYQVTRPKSLACPDLSMSKDAFKKIGIEFEEYAVPAATYEDDADWIPQGAWLDESVFKKGASGNVLCIGTHNVDEFKKLFDKSKPPAAHLILCQYQLDAETTECDIGGLPFDANDKIKFPPGSGTEVRGWSMPSSQVDPSCVFFKKALHNGGDPVVKISWKSKNQPLKNGDMAADDVIMDQAEHGNFVHIRLPAEAAALLDNDNTDKILVSIKVYWSKGWYAGWCTNGDQHNVIVASSPAKTVNATIIHEVGHAIDQTVTATNVPPGLAPKGTAKLHSRRYDGRGHSGSHCATGLGQAKYDDAGKTMSALGADSVATCTMYGCAVGNLDFCAECAPFAKACNPQSVST
jgi:hypothetical protein